MGGWLQIPHGIEVRVKFFSLKRLLEDNRSRRSIPGPIPHAILRLMEVIFCKWRVMLHRLYGWIGEAEIGFWGSPERG